MSEVAKIQQWIAEATEEAQRRIHRSVVAFEQGLPQPVADAAGLCSQLNHAHQMLGSLTIGKARL